MAGDAITATCSLEGEALSALEVPVAAGGVSAAVEGLKAAAMARINAYMAARQLDAGEVDLMEEAVEDGTTGEDRRRKRKQGGRGGGGGVGGAAAGS